MAFAFDLGAIDTDLASMNSMPDLGGNNQKKTYPFNRIRIGNLKNGDYKIRFVPAVAHKNPKGVYLVSTHGISTDAANLKTLMNVLHPVSITTKSDQYWGLHNMLRDLQANPNGLYEKLPEALKKVVTALCPYNRYWIPVYLWAKPVPGKDPRYPDYAPGDPLGKPIDCILEVNVGTKVAEKLIQLFKSNPNIGSVTDGVDCKLTKLQIGYEIAPASQEPLSEALSNYLFEKYPDLPNVARKLYFKSPIEIHSVCKASWWWQILSRTKLKLEEPKIEIPGFDLEDVPEESTDDESVDPPFDLA